MPKTSSFAEDPANVFAGPGHAPLLDCPITDDSALRWPCAAALAATALVLWRVGMDGFSAGELLAHTAFCWGAGQSAPNGAATLFGHCAACYAAVCLAAASLVAALWPASKPRAQPNGEASLR